MTQVTPNPRRPFTISLLSLVFLGLAVAGWARLGLTIANADLLVELNARPGGAYMAAGGVLWGVIGLPVAYGLWTGRPWAPRASVLAGTIYIFSAWLDRFISAQASQPPLNNNFALTVSLLGMGFLFWAVTTPKSQAFFNARKKAADSAGRWGR